MRIIPAGRPDQYQTFGIAAPLNSHWRPATCEEIECANYLNGWKTILPVDSDLIQVVKASGRRFTSNATEDGLIEFVFPKGQPCFEASRHRIRGLADEILYVRGGDWRGTTSPVEKIRRSEEWVERFQENQLHIIEAKERG